MYPNCMDLLQATFVAVLALLLGGVLGAALARRERSRPSRERELLAMLTEHTPVGLMIYANDGTIRYANRFAEELFFAGESASGRNYLSLVEQSPESLRSALLARRDAMFTVHRSGPGETFQLMQRVLQPDRPEPSVLLLINHLTREISRRETDLLKKVIRVMSHELNNSLASMTSLVSSGRYIVERPEHGDALVRVFDGLDQRFCHLRDFLVEYARLARMPQPRCKKVPWHPVLERLRGMFPGIRISAVEDATGWFDEAQLEQMLINLVKNALEAGSDAVDVEVRVAPGDRTDIVRVLDRGPGFSEEALQQALLPFYSSKEHGTGVGLALCREVVDSHGGTIELATRDGGGAAVTCRLPSADGDPVPSVPKTLTLT